MSKIRDVETWVDQIMSQIRGFRPHLSEAERAVQATILTALSTQTINFSLEEGQQQIEFSDKKGLVNEYLVKLDPDYPVAEMTETERAVEAYLLSFLRTYTPHFPVIPNKRFHSPDGFLIKIEKNKAIIGGIVEIKTTGSSEDLKRQLRGIMADLTWVVWLFNRNLENIRKHVGFKPELPDIGTVSWPKKVKGLSLEPTLQRLLFFSSDRKVEKGEIEGWTVMRSRFSIREVARIADIVWKDLVAKGGATKKQAEGAEVPIHRASQTPKKEGFQQVVAPTAVREHENTKEKDMADSECKRCNGEPVLFVERRAHKKNETLIPFFIEDQPVGYDCAEEFILTRMKNWASEIDRALRDARRRLPDFDVEGTRSDATARFQAAIDNLMPHPTKLFQARIEFEDTRGEVQVRVALALLGATKPKTKEENLEEVTRLEALANERLARLTGQTVGNGQYVAGPNSEGVTHNGDLLNKACDLYDRLHGSTFRGRALEAMRRAGLKTSAVDAVAAAIERQTDEAVAAASEPEEVKAPAGRFCVKCGHTELDPEANFCGNCQKSLPALGDQTTGETAAEPSPAVEDETPASPQPASSLGTSLGEILPADVVAAAKEIGANGDKVKEQQVNQPAALVAIATPPNQVECRECGSKNHKDRQDCRDCGALLQ